MKQIIIKLSLIILCTQPSLFSMDQPIALSQEEIISKIYYDIYQKYGSSPAHNDLFYGVANMITQFTLTPAECLDIIKIVQQHCACNKEIDFPDTISRLYGQNDFFKSAIDYFITCASNNLKYLTANNITTIENPQKQQPIAELNQLSLPIKTYVMNRALKQIKYTYDIVLSGQHQDDIQAFGICELTDQAVTSSFKEKPSAIQDFIGFMQPNDNTHNWNNIFLLWDLKTGKPIKNFDESHPINLLAFNPNGSYIAAAMFNENIVKIWCPKTGNVLHKLSSQYRIDTLIPNSHLLTVINKSNNSVNHPLITQWILKTDCTIGENISCFYVKDEWGSCGHCTKYNRFIGNKYAAIPPLTYPTGNKNELTITRRDCPYVWMCLQAIQRTDISLINPQDKIERSSSFQQLTSVERTNIYAAIQCMSQKNKKLELKLLDK